MVRSWFAFLSLICLASVVSAEQCQITSPLPVPVSLSGCTYAGFINASGYPLLSSATFVAGTNMTITQSGSSITFNSSGSGGAGTSTLAVTTGSSSGFGVPVSSPTAVFLGDQSQFRVSLQGSATALFTIAYTTNAQSGSYTATSTDTVILANCASNCTITLPTASGISGKVYKIKTINTAQVTVGTTSSQTIDGSITQVLYQQYTLLDVISDGSNWDIE